MVALVDFAQFVLKELDKDSIKRREMLNDVVKSYVSGLPNLIRGPTVYRNQVERIVKDFGAVIEKEVLTNN